MTEYFIEIKSGELVKAIEDRIKELGKNITNVEIQKLIKQLVKEKKAKIIGEVPEGMDIDLLGGNLREKGYKVLNLNEELRRKKQNEKE